jgi:hypothetical protein
LAASYILDDIQDIRFKVKEELRSSLFSLKQLPEKIEDGDVSSVDFITVIEEQQYTGKLK